MIEWDVASLNRKFQRTIASVSIGDKEPTWKYIRYISDDGQVFDKHDNVFGYVKTEKDGTFGWEPSNERPYVEFHYKPIYPGFYRHENSRFLVHLSKRHLKSYKIGLSTETFRITEIDLASGVQTAIGDGVRIKLDEPLMRFSHVHVEVFSPHLARLRTDLLCHHTRIGFAEGGEIVLKDPLFTNLVKPFLEGTKWQIVSL